MIPRIVTTTEKKLVGIRLTMTYDHYRIGELWQSFMPRRKELTNNLTSDLLSLAVYKPTHFNDRTSATEFERWAAVEVSDFDNVPDNMETFILSSGLYAVFNYIGLSSDTSVFHYILHTWLPDSNYILDHRPHFEVLGSKYKNNDPTSEEEIWIPVKPR